MNYYNKRVSIVHIFGIIFHISCVCAFLSWFSKTKQVSDDQNNSQNSSTNYQYVIPKHITASQLMKYVENNKNKKKFHYTGKLNENEIKKILVQLGFYEELKKEGFIYKNITNLRNLETDDYKNEITPILKLTTFEKACKGIQALVNSTSNALGQVIGGAARYFVADFDYSCITDGDVVSLDNYRTFCTKNLLKPPFTKMRIATKRTITSDPFFDICDPNYASSRNQHEAIFNLKNIENAEKQKRINEINQKYNSKNDAITTISEIASVNPLRFFNFKTPYLPFVESDFTNYDYILEEPSGTNTLFGFIAYINSGLVFYDFESKETYNVKFYNIYGYYIRLQNREIRHLNIKSVLVNELIDINYVFGQCEWNEYDPLCFKVVATEKPYLFASSCEFEQTVKFINIDIRKITQGAKMFDSFVKYHKSIKNNVINRINKNRKYNIDDVEEEQDNILQQEEVNANKKVASSNTAQQANNVNNGQQAANKQKSKTDANKKNKITQQNDQNDQNDKNKKEEKNNSKQETKKDKSGYIIYIFWFVFVGSMIGIGACCYLYYTKKSVII
ncbi:hypothetical protein BDAP_001555 [Binucleata daphniae]